VKEGGKKPALLNPSPKDDEILGLNRGSYMQFFQTEKKKQREGQKKKFCLGALEVKIVWEKPAPYHAPLRHLSN